MSSSRIPTVNFSTPQASFLIRPLIRQIDQDEYKEPPHRHNFQELLWIKSGSGHQLVDSEQFTIKPLTFYLIPKGQIHYFNEGIDLEGFLVRFSDDFLQESVGSLSWNYRQTLFSHFTRNRSLSISAANLRRYEGLLQRMWQEQQTKSFGYQAVQRHLLSILLVQLERTRQLSTNDNTQLSKEASIYKEFLEYLERFYRTHHVVTFYADKVGISARKLTQVCRQHAGKTAKTLIQERVVLEAQRYLQHTNLSVKEISYRLGFRDPAYFSKAFKAVVGVAPQAYEVKLSD